MASTKAQILTWIICDGVHIDPATGKYYILGTFSNIRVRQFPARHPHMVWFLTLTSVRTGEHQLRISFNPSLEPPKTVVERKFKAQSPAHRISLVNPVVNLELAEAGEQVITIEVDDDPILVTTLSVSGPSRSPAAE